MFTAKHILVKCRCRGMVLETKCPLCQGQGVRSIEINKKPEITPDPSGNGKP